ncbi:COG1470 family protein [Phycisphaera mikurensis]|uniref:DUF11 domain-containing protein n=1 Tax=Phycisphaera mikurensis (strain NBRC 102666 / KCTC 22515 / FYK2301M01) TaxID=1142394 RepID=I0IH24_PHYMF|nr:DUF11 domain-containing protein [Phycisphaera mikurensis]MBB6440817.1 putative repeat protein (TIGR01451 family) [Phycisphaera mikurensis]BAM04562.1 hypothetical protein PSMK_24030 [Phycisphaera mikurensis NBRC 102666]
MMNSPFRISSHAAGLTALAVSAAFVGACDNRPATEAAVTAVPVTPVVAPATAEVAAVAPAAYGVHDHAAHAQAQPASDTERTVSTGTTAEVGAGELLTIERMMPEQVFANSENRFTLKASNNSDKILHNVVLHHAMIGDFQVVQTNTPSEVKVPQGVQKGERGDQQMAEQSFNIGVLMPGDSREVTIAGRPGGEGQLHSCVWADYSAAECAPIQVVAPQVTMEHLFVDAEGNPVSQAYLCDDVFVMYRLQNVGTGETGRITVNEELPQGLVAADGQRSISLDVDPIGAGETFESEPVQLDLEQAKIQRSGMMDVFGRAIGTGDRVSDLSGSSPLTLMKPELTLQVRSPGEQFFGRDVSIEAVVENVSDVPARDVVVTLPLPADAQRVSLNDASLTVADGGILIDELAPGESRTVGVTFRPASPGDYSGVAVANGYCAVRLEKPVQLSVVGIPALQLETIDTQDPVEVGAETTYRVRIINEGNAADTNLTITGQLPEGFAFVSGSEDVTNENGELSLPVYESLDAGEEIYFEVVARAEQPGRVKFTLNVKSDNLADAEETEPTTAF